MTKSKSNLIKSVAGIFFALQIIGATVILSCPLPAFAQSKADSVNSLQFTPQVTIPNSNFVSDASTSVGAYNSATGKMDSTLLAQYIGAIYNYGLAIAGILATIMLMAAGVIWLTSGGDSGKVTQAKELISGSIAGLIILIVSWVILNTINPDLVNLKAVSTTVIEAVKVEKGCCEKGSQAMMVNTKKECDKTGGTYVENSEGYNVTVADGKCLKSYVYCVVRVDCDGNIQFCYDTDVSKKPSFIDNCGTFFKQVNKDLNIIQTGRCDKIQIKQDGVAASGCAGKQISCTGAKDGTACQESGNGNAVDGYCYDNLCHIGPAKAIERCGIQNGAFCSVQQCKDLSNATYVEDKTGVGRKCGVAVSNNNIYNSDPMYCCYDSNKALPSTNQNSAVWGPACGNENGKCYLPGSTCPSGFNWDWGGKNCSIGRCCKAD